MSQDTTKQDIQDLKQGIQDLVQGVKQDIQDLFEMLVVVRDNAVTREDLKNFATKDDLKALEHKMDEGFFFTSYRVGK